MTRKRSYERSHPWLTFSLDLRTVPLGSWLLLGEARSKCEHLAGVPLDPDTAKRLHTIYLAKGVQGTTAIEGNTLSEEQIEDIINGTSVLPKSKEYLKQEAQNILDACRNIVQHDRFPVTKDNICELNRMVLHKLSVEDGVVPGELRQHIVGVFRYRAPEGRDCEYLVDRLCIWLDELDRGLPEEIGRIGKAVLRAVIGHLYTAWIHPFGDGNGRTARLLEVAILLEAGVPTPAAYLLSNHYNETRAEYYRQLDYASKSGWDINPFIKYALQGFVDGLKAQLDKVREQQLKVAWQKFVHDRFKDDPPSLRCKHLIFDLAAKNDFVARKDLTSVSTRVLKDYQGKTERTLLRDIQALTACRLIEFRPKLGYRARTEIIAAFLPHAKSRDSAPPKSSRRVSSADVSAEATAIAATPELTEAFDDMGGVDGAV